MFGFTNTLLDVLSKENPTHIAVVFDTSAPTFRHEMFPEYKAQRQEMPEDLSLSIPYIFDLIRAFNIPVITYNGFEADDIIGTLAFKASKKGFKTYMMTPDKDFAQLVSDHIFIYKPARMGNGAEIITPEKVLEKWGIQDPKQVIDILALWGDAVDNIPGIPGFGEKTAKELIATYGSVEALIDHVDELKGARQKKVKEFAEQALLSKKLATIITHVPVELDETQLQLEEPNRQALDAVFKELEFRTFHKRILGQAHQPAQPDLFSASGGPNSDAHQTQEPTPKAVFKSYDPAKQSYKLIQSEEQLKTLVEKLLQTTEFAFDTETDSLDAMQSQIVGIAFTTQEHTGYYVNLNHNQKGTFLSILKPALQGPQLKIAQNLKFDLKVLRREGVEVSEPFFDTMLAHYLLEPDKRHNMDELARNYLQYEPISIESLIGKKGKNQLSMKNIDPEIIAPYAAEDTDITFQLKQLLAPLIKQNNLEEVLYQIELPLVHVLADMEIHGVNLDSDFLNRYSIELKELIEQLENQIYELAGKSFNIASPKQMGEVLFKDLALLEKPKKTKTGQFQTNEEVLQKLLGKHPIIDHILDYRELTKLKSTYVDALPQLVNPNTQRIHTSFNQAVAATGRLSSNNPNLQNIPIKTQKGREIRKAFIGSTPNHLIVSADYSQIELRVIASISQDPNMIQAFKNNEDIHTATAAKIFNVPYTEVTKDMRSQAKTVNFGIIYGISAFGLSERMGISRKDAKEIIDTYFEKFAGIKQYMENSIALAQQKGYVETLKGRRRYIPDINSKNMTVRGFAERNAINAPIQGTAADMIKLAMLKVHKRLKKEHLKATMILQVHDELIIDAPNEELEKVKALLIEEMTKAMPLHVPILVEAGQGNNWLEAH